MALLDRFRETNALLEGHFVLSSGLHSPQYLQCALALQLPADAASFGQAISEKIRTETAGQAEGAIDAIASPAIGGLVIGFSVAQALGVPFVWTERQDGEMTLRRGFDVGEYENIVVVEDVITTGGSTRECIAALERRGGNVIAAASIIDRSNGSADVGVPRFSLITMDVPSYRPEECPLCARGVDVLKPGSRKA